MGESRDILQEDGKTKKDITSLGEGFALFVHNGDGDDSRYLMSALPYNSNQTGVRPSFNRITVHIAFQSPIPVDDPSKTREKV